MKRHNWRTVCEQLGLSVCVLTPDNSYLDGGLNWNKMSAFLKFEHSSLQKVVSLMYWYTKSIYVGNVSTCACLFCSQGRKKTVVQKRSAEQTAQLSIAAAMATKPTYTGADLGGVRWVRTNPPFRWFIRLTGSLLLPAVFDTLRWRASPVWLLYNLRAI